MKKSCIAILLLCALLLSGCTMRQAETDGTQAPEDTKTAPYTSPWGDSVAVQKDFERIEGASDLGMTSGQELIILDFMERYYRSLADLEVIAIRDLFTTEAEAAYHRCIWNSMIAIRKAAPEDLSLTGYSYLLTADTLEEESTDICTVTLRENNVQYFAALEGTPAEQWKVQHGFVLRRLTGDRWVIEYHECDDNPYMNAAYDTAAEEDMNLATLLNLVEQRQEEREEAATSSVPPYDHAYDRGAAKKFMLQYVTQRDPAYPAYDDAGGNCMNFGSQTLLAGGIPMDRKGKTEECWYNYGRRNLTKSFINVGTFLDYAAANTGSGLVAQVGAAYYSGEVGDIITMGIEDARNHTTVICDILRDEQGQVLDYLLCSNTANLRNFPAGAYYYTNQQLTKIYGWND